MDYVGLGKNISAARKKRQLTQEQLAELTDVSTVFISQIETAVRKPSLETMYKLAKSLGTTIDSLIDANNSLAISEEMTSILSNRTESERIFLHSIICQISDYMEKNRR